LEVAEDSQPANGIETLAIQSFSFSFFSDMGVERKQDMKET
jgi:hypothetical protein